MPLLETQCIASLQVPLVQISRFGSIGWRSPDRLSAWVHGNLEIPARLRSDLEIWRSGERDKSRPYLNWSLVQISRFGPIGWRSPDRRFCLALRESGDSRPFALRSGDLAQRLDAIHCVSTFSSGDSRPGALRKNFPPITVLKTRQTTVRFLPAKSPAGQALTNVLCGIISRKRFLQVNLGFF